MKWIRKGEDLSQNKKTRANGSLGENVGGFFVLIAQRYKNLGSA
jgi:hypothetical protein